MKACIRFFFVLVALVFLITACGGAPQTPTNEVQVTNAVPTETSTPTVEPTLAIPDIYLGGTMPVSGAYIADLEPFDQAMIDYMNERGIDAAELVLIKDDLIVFSHAYGWFDEEHTKPLSTDAVMRIASVSKPITKALIYKLINNLLLKSADKVFCLDGNTTDCILTIEPIAGASIDPRMKDITVKMLLEHQGGWDRDVSSFDPMFKDITIANALGVTPPVDKYQIASYMMGRNLDFTPGEKEVYSNFGYSLLGIIVEKVTGKTYLQAVQDEIFAPLDVANVTIAQTLPENRLPNEAHYNCPGKGPSVFVPGTNVCWPDGGWNIDHMDAHGGILTSAETLGKFISNYCIGTGFPKTDSCGEWAFYGELDGTLAMVIQRSDNLSWVVILNQRQDASHGLHEDIRDVIDALMPSVNNMN
jgi:CubicO group peptidase (beta-lactamase class C family)